MNYCANYFFFAAQDNPAVVEAGPRENTTDPDLRSEDATGKGGVGQGSERPDVVVRLRK